VSGHRFVLTDVFAAHRYGGIQLATFPDATGLTDDEMAAISRELRLPRTTFVTGRDPDGGYAVRIFPSEAEAGFDGHPVVGTAYVIATELADDPDAEITLNLRSRQVPVARSPGPDARSMFWMTQAAPEFGTELYAAELAPVFGVESSQINGAHPVQEVSTGLGFIVVPMASLEALRSIKLDAHKSEKVGSATSAKAIVAFAPEGYVAEEAIAIRVFAGQHDTSEDTATGSAAGCVAAYLGRHQVLGGPEVDTVAGQGYEVGRPSRLGLRVTESDGVPRVAVGGYVVEVASGVWGD
jgi:trans-2,3-dihydro-3-hydroxyanthranilate isomerase